VALAKARCVGQQLVKPKHERYAPYLSSESTGVRVAAQSLSQRPWQVSGSRAGKAFGRAADARHTIFSIFECNDCPSARTILRIGWAEHGRFAPRQTSSTACCRCRKDRGEHSWESSAPHHSLGQPFHRHPSGKRNSLAPKFRLARRIPETLPLRISLRLRETGRWEAEQERSEISRRAARSTRSGRACLLAGAAGNTCGTRRPPGKGIAGRVPGEGPGSPRLQGGKGCRERTGSCTGERRAKR